MSKKCPICGRGIGVYQDYVGGTSFLDVISADILVVTLKI